MPDLPLIVVELPGEPRGKGRPRSRVAWTKADKPFVAVYTDAQTRAYEKALGFAALSAMRGHMPFAEAISVSVEAFFAVPPSWTNKRRDAALAGAIRPTGSPDSDNIAKMLDALNGIAWRDDALIVELLIRKHYDEHPRLRIEIKPLGIFDAGQELPSGTSLAERARG